MPEDNQEQRRRGDQEMALLLGRNCGLGEIRVIARARKYWVALWGGLLAFVAQAAPNDLPGDKPRPRSERHVPPPPARARRRAE
jgi:hypothetical protein